MTEGNRQREQESKRAHYRPRPLEQDIFLLCFPCPCYSQAYLAMWAILGRRSPDQRALTWRQTLASHVEFMGKVNYPRKTRLRRYAAKAEVEIAFLEKQELLLRDFGNAGGLVSRAGRLGLDRLLAGVLALRTTLHGAQGSRGRSSSDVKSAQQRPVAEALAAVLRSLRVQ